MINNIINTVAIVVRHIIVSTRVLLHSGRGRYAIKQRKLRKSRSFEKAEEQNIQLKQTPKQCQTRPRNSGKPLQPRNG